MPPLPTAWGEISLVVIAVCVVIATIFDGVNI
jgi:hypothetical protein